MMKIRYIAAVACLMMASITCVMADVPAANIRYVKTDAAGGLYTNDGKSWATAKNNIQDAINSLVALGAYPGEVWVGAGTYKPTESTESSGGSTLYMSFMIPAGITVRGGFPADGKQRDPANPNAYLGGSEAAAPYIDSPDQRPTVNYSQMGEHTYFVTVLSGDLTSQSATFAWNDTKQQFTTTFYGNCYHVVTFATNGFHADGHAKALDTSGGKGEACLEAVLIQHGNAYNTSVTGHPHNAYGGGVYMVKGSRMERVVVRECSASRDGGGVYMDGGGWIEHSYISMCQSLGIGSSYGFGGGLCMEDGTYLASDPTKGFYPTVAQRVGITGCVARNGGGMAVKVNDIQYKTRLAASAVIIANNVAHNEAGGLYLHQGGAMSQMSILRNKCVGNGVSVGGVVSGRSGGVYVRDYAIMANTVIWGNECEANKNIQYAGSRSNANYKPQLFYVALSRSDYADWSGVIKHEVMPLSYYNKADDPTQQISGKDVPKLSGEGYPGFVNPSASAGYVKDVFLRSMRSLSAAEIAALGVTDDGAAYNWKVDFSSTLANAGVQTLDLDTANVTPALDQSIDVMGNVFSSRPTIGAYVPVAPSMAACMGAPTQDPAKGPVHEGVYAHIFVDPNAEYVPNVAFSGTSWNTPIRNLADALYLMDKRLQSVLSSIEWKPTKVIIHVKEGTVDDAGYYISGRVRGNTLEMPHIPASLTYKDGSDASGITIEIVGGYPSGNTLFDLTGRNPLKYPTIISGDIVGDYDFNTAHLVTFDRCKNILFDGFQLRNGNATSTKQGTTNQNGAAFTIENSENISIKNCLVAGCQAEIGAAVYAKNSTVDFENCIFHNNAVTQRIGVAGKMPGIVFATTTQDALAADSTCSLTFDHCDVLRNVGFAGWLDAAATMRWTNSIFYGNFNQAVDDTNDADMNPASTPVLAAFGGTTANATGNYCLFDERSAGFTQFNSSRFDMSYVFNGGANSDYPRFINPTKNCGISPSGDITYYGRAASFEPYNTNPMVNAASFAGDHSTWGTDITCTITRDYGGLPDIGAVENHSATTAEGENAYQDGQSAYGSIYYVRDYRDGSGNIDYSHCGDGMSWANAINGNAYYIETTGMCLGSETSYTGTITVEEDVFSESEGASSNAPTYSTIANPTYIKIKNAGNSKYLKYSNNTFTFVDNFDDGDKFVLIGSNNNAYVYDATANIYISYSTSGTGASLSLSLGYQTSQSNAKQWKLTNNGAIYYQSSYSTGNGWRRTTYYINHTLQGNTSLGVNKGTASTSNAAPTVSGNQEWSYVKINRTKTGTTTVEKPGVTVYGINGLQYAINKAGKSYASEQVAKEVWVGAGTYSKNPETQKNGYFEVESGGDKSCFIIRDGVYVYGAFPKVGNPGKDQRQALVSQHVKVNGDYIPADYETILQPLTTTIQSGVARRVLGQPLKNNPYYASYTGDYNGATWDGFTLRYGVVDNTQITVPDRPSSLRGGAANGGAGVTFYKNVTLRNMVITNNTMLRTGGGDCLGGGVYLHGGTMEQCYVINNTNQGWSGSSKSQSGHLCYGGGMTIENGTVFNSVIANNYAYAQYADGAGLFIYNANFFNNTVANNKAEGTTRYSGGIAVWTNTSTGRNVLNIYNTISVNNVGYVPSPYSDQASCGDKNIAIQAGGELNVYNSISEAVANSSSTKGGGAVITFNSSYAAGTLSNLIANLGNYGTNFNTLDLRLKSGSLAINKGLVNPTIAGVTYDLSEYRDMDYTERVKDCSIDVGAYEFNDAYAIAPTVDGNVASYYVTPYGRGLASATDPANAGCADKLQKVLDAAGRYKTQNPTKQVVVKVATDESTKNSADPFTYYANRTIDPDDQDVRLWAIIVPRGVEVWGGYTNTFTSATNNGFTTRDVTANPTYFDATYSNKLEKTTATSYHVVHFTERLFDANGEPYHVGDNIGQNVNDANADKAYRSMSEFTQDRAVLDGIYLTGGKADAPTGTGATVTTAHQYGGAAIVAPYAHVRNCIIEGNTALYGGALALRNNALVSGCLIRNNEASEAGGAIYVFEDNKTYLEATGLTFTMNTAKGAGALDENMPHIYLSTIVRNTSAEKGGGIWFSSANANVRVNSSVFWQNEAADQGEVAGLYNPGVVQGSQTSTVEYYPFAYSAVQQLKMPGTNNVELQPINKNGARFAKTTAGVEDHNTMATDETTYADFGYYGLTDLSALVRTGMSLNEYNALKTSAALSTTDFTGVDRLISNANAPARTYIEIGARAHDKQFHSEQLMLRLYVAQPEDVDADAAFDMASLNPDVKPSYWTGTLEAWKEAAGYYKQQGSSFAYPFQTLQDALDYIYLMRSTKLYSGSATYLDQFHANNLPFEIIVSKGTYYPTRDMAGHYGQSTGNTFAIPEGVSIYGGFSATARSGKFYGRYYKPKATIPAADIAGKVDYSIADNVDRVPGDAERLTPASASVPERDLPGNMVQILSGTNIVQADIYNMLLYRAFTDINGNNIIEPWELQNQTILSGEATNNAGEGVYHVVSVVPDENVVGVLPNRAIDRTKADWLGYVYSSDGYHDYEEGQTVLLNGLTIQDGNATGYVSGSLDEAGLFNFYLGGGLLVDGKRYCNKYYDGNDLEYKNRNISGSVAYRDIPVVVTQCHFQNNRAGYGGAIASNSTLDVFNSSFELNEAVEGTEEVTGAEGTRSVHYPGDGAAIFGTHHVAVFNSLIANNEASNSDGRSSVGKFTSYANPDAAQLSNILSGCGAVYMGGKGYFHIVNSNVVNNRAVVYPVAFTSNPNTGAYLADGTAPFTTYSQFLNSVVWGNSARATGSVATMANLICNYGAKNRSTAYDPTLASISQSALDAMAEVAWFTAYETGKGITPDNTNDFRDADFDPVKHADYQLSHYDPAGGTAYYPYQNCNIGLASSNDVLEGPNFVKPSLSAGIAGYMQSADWSPARLSNLTDNGSGKISQAFDAAGNPTFPTTAGKFVGSGAYYQVHYLPGYTHYNDNLPFGNDPYMQYTDKQPIYRISGDPNPSHGMTYIDLGMYEYVHVPLVPETDDEVDVLWVSNYEKPENGKPNGHSWLTPTSDLQRAIETLLSSRNGHRKEIRLCDGTYSPIYTIEGTLSFYIDTKFLNSAATGTDGMGIKSLTIKGGYSKDFNNVYDVDLYPVVLRQQEHSVASEKYNHLLFINDATQRYHASGASPYVSGNGYGWTNGAHTGIHTFPIQIEGVTLVNDQAQAGVKGAALYYREPTFGSDYAASDAAVSYTATSTTGASLRRLTDKVDIANPAKLILTKVTVAGSGAKGGTDKTTSAVYIGEKGGNTLIYNSVFHSNFGDPLVASNAVTVNNTFALNAGLVRLNNFTSTESSKDQVSTIKNSVLWLNNATSATTYGPQFSLADYTSDAASGSIFAYNAYTGGNTTAIEYDPMKSTAIQDNNYNVGLKDQNTDVTYGPNFVDPSNAVVLSRSFQISPSMRLLNQGNNALYGDTIRANYTGSDIVYDLAWVPSKDMDAASANRIAADRIDIGAYEYQYDLNRVLYVDPNMTGGTGLDWQHALGIGSIQSAIDLAGVYYTNNHKSAYVFVKAASATNLNRHTGETITLRDGVQIYGSILSDYGVECPYKNVALGSKERNYMDEVLDAYVNDMLLYGRDGVITPGKGHTRIEGINTNGTAFSLTTDAETKCTLIDGFEVTPDPSKASKTYTTAPVYIKPNKGDNDEATGNVEVVVRNIAVHGFTTSACPVVYVNNAMLYSALVHHNTATTALNVAPYGYVVNATVEGSTTGTTSHVINSLVNMTDADKKTLSGYCYAVEDQNLNYQLTEMSKNIDACTVASIDALPAQYNHPHLIHYGATAYDAATATTLNTKIGDCVVVGSSTLTIAAGEHLNADRDLLGNFRWQPSLSDNANKIDRGAFETWKVEKTHQVQYPNYPYPGSVEYVMAGQSLVIDAPASAADVEAHRPAFLLLQKGASLYGNGRAVKIAYLAVEHDKKKGVDVVLSAPWDQLATYVGLEAAGYLHATEGICVPAYNATTGALIYNRRPNGALYTYDASKRADWQYRMASASSPCWKPVLPGDILPACHGMLLSDDDSDLAAATNTYRFTGRGTSMTDYIYTETVETGDEQHISKTVVLDNNDAHPADGSAHFTDEKNAGWNLVGMPYLTSEYHPYNKPSFDAKGNVVGGLKPGDAGYDAAPYGMDHPQKMWMYYNGTTAKDGTTPADGTAGFYSVNSWESGAAAWHVASDAEAMIFFGEGFFVQTHTLQDHEDLVFYRPVYYPSSPAPARARYYVVDADNADNANNANVGEIISPSQLDEMKRGYEKIVYNDHVYIVRRDDAGRILDAFDVTGRRVNL